MSDDALNIHFLLQKEEISEEFIKNLFKESWIKYYPDAKYKSGYLAYDVGGSIYNPNFQTAIKKVVNGFHKSNYACFFALRFEEITFLLHFRVIEKYLEITLSVDRVYFSPNAKEIIVDAKENTKAILDLTKKLYSYLNPLYVDGTNLDRVPNFLINVINGKLKLNEVGWLSIFNPKLVKLYGKRKLQSIRSWKTEILRNSGIMVVKKQSPFGYDL